MILFDRDILGARCAVWHVTETLDQLVALLPNGDEIMQEAQSRFKSDSRRTEWVAVRVLLHAMLGETHKIDYLDNGSPELRTYGGYISISHTKGYVCVALSKQERIGVDIEQITNRVERVRSRFVSDDESADTLLQLLVAWSAKESAYKLLQRTEVDFVENLRISGMPYINNVGDKGDFLITYINNEERIPCDVAFEVFNDFVLTVGREKQTIDKFKA